MTTICLKWKNWMLEAVKHSRSVCRFAIRAEGAKACSTQSTTTSKATLRLSRSLRPTLTKTCLRPTHTETAAQTIMFLQARRHGDGHRRRGRATRRRTCSGCCPARGAPSCGGSARGRRRARASSTQWCGATWTGRSACCGPSEWRACLRAPAQCGSRLLEAGVSDRSRKFVMSKVSSE